MNGITPCRCQCEQSNHFEPAGEGCFEPAAVTIVTDYGRFRVCAQCARDYYESGFGKPLEEAEAAS